MRQELRWWGANRIESRRNTATAAAAQSGSKRLSLEKLEGSIFLGAESTITNSIVWSTSPPVPIARSRPSTTTTLSALLA